MNISMRTLWVIIVALGLGFTAAAQQQVNNFRVLTNLYVGGAITGVTLNGYNIDAVVTNSAAAKLDITNGVASGLSLGGTTIYSGDGSNNLTANTLFNLGLRGSNGETVSVYPTAHTTKNIASLVGLNTGLVTTNATVEVRGYYEPGDGGGGTFYYAPYEATNRGTVFQAGSASFVWKRLVNGSITPEMFGAIANDGNSDQAALDGALAYLDSIGGGVLQFKEGEYQVSGLNLPRFVLLRGAAAQGQKSSTEGNTVLKLINGSHNAHVITSTNECQIENLQIDGNKANVTGTSYGIYFNRPGIYIESAVSEVSVVNCRTAGIVVNANEITVRNSSVIESDGYGIWVQGVAWDTILQSVLVGWSGSDGLLFESGAAFTRVMNVDSYFSRGTGIKVIDPAYFTLYKPQIDYSFGHGLEMVVNASGANADIELPTIHDSNAQQDGRGRTNTAASGTYSEVCISGTNYPARIMFRDGRIAPLATGTLKPLYNLCWSNTVPAVGYGVTLRGINLETVSGVRTASGKSAADGWLTGYWNGLLQSYYDGTNATTFERSTSHSARWAGITPINASTTMNGALTLGSTLAVAGTSTFTGNVTTGARVTVGDDLLADYVVTGGAVYSGREVTTTKAGVQIKADTGETFGLSSFGSLFIIASDSDSRPGIQFNGTNDSMAFVGVSTFATNVAVTGTLTASQAIELGHASDTTLARSAAGVVTIEGLTVLDYNGTPTTGQIPVFTNGAWSVMSPGASGIGGSTGSTDNSLLRADGTGGATLQSSAVIVDDYTSSTANNVAIRIDDGSTANIAAVITPKGDGAFILGPKPDGTTTGGNARGQYAVDLQLSHAAWNQAVASGNYSLAGVYYARALGAYSVALGYGADASAAHAAAIGGHAATASGTYSFVGGGYASSASGQQSAFLAGQGSASATYAVGAGEAAANKRGQFGISGGSFAASGDSQSSIVTVRNSTTNTTATELFTDGSSGRLTLANNSAWTFEAKVTGITSGAAASYSYILTGFIRRGANAAATTMPAVATPVVIYESNAGADVSATADTTNGSLKIAVTAFDSTATRWSATVIWNQVGY